MTKKPEEETNPVSMAKKFILKENGVEDKDVEQIRTNEEADELIEYLQKKTNDEEKDEDKMISFRGNVGHKPDKLPPPEELNETYKQNLRQALNPLAPVKGTNNRWKGNSRLLVHFDKDNPDGRLF